MGMRNILSVATSGLVVAISIGAIAYGAALTRFEAAPFTSDGGSPEFFSGYSDLVGLRGPARRIAAPEYALETASRSEIEAVLKVEPANAAYWLALAQNLQEGGGSQDAALSALRMSEAVEPRESATMALRAAFILRHWETLPESEQRLAIANLVELGAGLPDRDRERIVSAVAAKSEATRDAIRAAFLEKTGGDRALLTGMGL
jgi:hypothetical protein